MIVATVGHVDHGKTTLVRALTGVDTDRLAEEKRRGLTIEPGFAYQQLADGNALAFVDLPGHQRFVHNMLACVPGVALGLLVVAADDGPMPQTIEHLDILALLGVPALMVALTRIDRVDTARRTQATAEVRALLADGPFRDATLHAVSAPTGEGVAALREALVDAVKRWRPAASTGHFRFALDRSFTLHGTGIIATGTVFAGRVTRGDRVLQMPGGRELRVRGLHADDRPAEGAGRGQRVALNVSGAGVHASDLHRGDWLVAPALDHAESRIDAKLRLLASAPRPLRHWSEVHLHLGAAHLHARVAILGAGTVPPGGEALVQLVADRPLHAVRGDRLVVRDQSATTTLGGGVVLDPQSPRRGRARPARLAALRALAERATPDAFAALLATAAHGVDVTRFARICNLAEDERTALLMTTAHRWLDTVDGGVAIDEGHFQALADALLTTVGDWHEREPHSQGPDIDALRRAMPGRSPAALLRAVAGTLLAQGRLSRRGLMLHLPGHAARLDAQQQANWQRARALLAAPGGSAPTLHQLAGTLGQPVEDLRALLKNACAAGLCLHVARNRYLPADTAHALASQVEVLATRSPASGFSVAGFRDHAGIGRNFAVDLLEFFDRVGLTRRDGEHRRLASTAASLFGAEQA